MTMTSTTTAPPSDPSTASAEPTTTAAAQLPPAPAARSRSRLWVRALVSGTFGRPRFVTERPPALLEHVSYATSGEWTTERDGIRRSLALTYARLVAIPVSTVCYLLAWLSARPGRFATALVVGTTVWLVLTALPSLVVHLGGWQQ